MNIKPITKAFITNNILIPLSDGSEVRANYIGEYWKIVADIVIPDDNKVSNSRRIMIESKILVLKEITDAVYHDFVYKAEKYALENFSSLKAITEIPNKVEII